MVVNYTLDGKLISATYMVTVLGDSNEIESGDCQYTFGWEQNGYTQKELKLTGYTDYARNLSMYSGEWYNMETWEPVAAPDGFAPQPCVFVGPTTITIETAAESGDQSWMKPAPQERAVYASVPEFKEAPLSPFISIEKTDSGIRCIVDGLTAWGVTAETLNGIYYNSNYEETETTLAAAGDGKWAVELPEDAYATYHFAGADGKKISVSFGTTDSAAYIEINTGSVDYTILDNEQISMVWQLSETEYIEAYYRRDTGELTRYDVGFTQDTDALYYTYKSDNAGSMELILIEYTVADSSAEYGQKSCGYTKSSAGWDRTDYDTWETVENIEVPEEVLSRCVELPLI